MAIFIDANILPRSGPLLAPHIAVLIAVARSRNAPIIIPSIVLEEAISTRRREAEEAFTALASAHKKAAGFASIPPIYIPDPEESANDWRSQLTEAFTVGA